MQANNLIMAGQYQDAFELLGRAKPLLDATKDPRLLFSHDFNKTVCLLHLDRFSEAASLLPIVEVAVDQGNELDKTRLRWLQGRTWAGLGRRPEALAALSQVRQYFLSNEIAYDFAVVSVELGTLYLEMGCAKLVREMADQMAWAFESHGIHERAMEALTLFSHAAREEEAQTDWARDLVRYLYRAQYNPQISFCSS
jgi:tetratricopeptide (TPR) repeat protein